MIEFMGEQGLRWSKTFVADFWSAGLASIQTVETESGKLGWIQGDEDGIWFSALERTALNLICQYAVMAVDLSNEEICRVPIRDALRAVQSFAFDDLTPAVKKRLVIRPATGDLFCADLSVSPQPDSDDSDNAGLIPTPATDSSKELTPAPDACACIEFTARAVSNEAAYATAAAAEEIDLTMEFARETTELLCRKQFARRAFCLDMLRAPPLQPETADPIGLRYRRLLLRAKTKFHVDQMKVEVGRLCVLVQQRCRRIKEMESEIKYVESLEAEQEDQVRILRRVQQQQKELRLGIQARQDALK